jgi:hypothetical protein
MQNTHEFAVRTAFSRRNENAPNSSVPAAVLFPDGLWHVLLKRRPVLGVGISYIVSRGIDGSPRGKGPGRFLGKIRILLPSNPIG